MRITGWDNPEADILRLVNNWLSDEANGRWFMIVDNADDARVFSTPADKSKVGNNNNTAASTDTLSEFLPQSQNGSILVTSRSRDVAFRITGDTRDIIMVDPMDEEDAIKLLHMKLQGNFNEDDAKRLLHTLDYMPLAITQAAAFISQRTPHTTLSKYLENLQKGDADRARLLNRHITDNRRDGKASNSIIATWQISFESIRKERPSASQLLSLMCLFNRQGIPKSLLDHRYQESDKTESDFEDDIYTLSSYSLIGTNLDATEFEMHRLVQFSTKTWLELKGELEYWKEKFINVMDEEFPIGKYENWTICQALFPHAEMALECRPENKEIQRQWASIVFKAGWYADEAGNYDTAEKLKIQAVNTYETLGSEDTMTLASKNNLAEIYRKQGRWKEAEELEVLVMETRKRVLGVEHPSTLTSMANLASTYRNQGRWKEAEELEVLVMETSKRVLGVEHLSTLTSMANLAFTFKGQRRDEEALALMDDCVQMRKQVLGQEHPFATSSQAALNQWRMGNLDLNSVDSREE
jgi:tetratricopeptide (TPR) repeat protein